MSDPGRNNDVVVAPNGVLRPKGLTHAESKALTRSRLIAVGRKYFLERGFTNSVAEEITREAGYTRGALHSNFGNKEGLLLEVARECHKIEIAVFEKVADKYSGKRLITELRDAVARSVNSPNYLLMTEFEIEAFRNKTLHAAFHQFQEEALIEGHRLTNKVLAENPSFHLEMTVADFITAIDSFRRGLMIRLLLSQSDISQERGYKMISDFFDCYGFKIRKQSIKGKGNAPSAKKQRSRSK